MTVTILKEIVPLCLFEKTKQKQKTKQKLFDTVPYPKLVKCYL